MLCRKYVIRVKTDGKNRNKNYKLYSNGMYVSVSIGASKSIVYANFAVGNLRGLCAHDK